MKVDLQVTSRTPYTSWESFNQARICSHVNAGGGNLTQGKYM